MLVLQRLLTLAIGRPVQMDALLINQVKRQGGVDQSEIQIFELLLNLARGEALFVKTGDRVHSHAGAAQARSAITKSGFRND